MLVPDLLKRAKEAIESGESALHAAAEDIAAAQEQGATQRQIAEAVGKSAALVNRLLKWRESGYTDDTPFGPQAKVARQRAQRVYSTEQKKPKPATSSEQAEAAAARGETVTVPKIDKPDVGDGGHVYAEQYVEADEALFILAEFAKFIIARIASQGKNIIVTVTENDADQFRSLCGRAKLAIGTESGAAFARGRR
jgi:hypothetical protein